MANRHNIDEDNRETKHEAYEMNIESTDFTRMHEQMRAC